MTTTTGNALAATPPDTANAYVFDFSEGDRSKVDLLGGKGANLAEMTRMGLPVPPGFTITTEAAATSSSTATRPRACGRRSRSTSDA